MMLELLSETGVIGTIAIIASIVIGLTKTNFDILTKRAKSGSAIFPLFLALLLQAMISYDLATNIVFISFITVVFRTNEPITQKNKVQLVSTNIRHDLNRYH
jgi:spore maturation protein SpmB